MSKPFPLVASLFLLAGIGLVVAGCAKEQASQEPATSPEASPSQPAAAEPAGQQDNAQADNGQAESGMAGHDMSGMTGHDMAGMGEEKTATTENKYQDVLAQLSPEDQALAAKQKVCPVSGQPLGVMGKPYKVTVEGRDVLLCCPACKAKIEANPDQYLAKLPQ